MTHSPFRVAPASPRPIRQNFYPTIAPHSPQRSPLSPSPTLRSPSNPPRRKTRRFYYFTLLSEASLKLLINGLLLSAFSVALIRLVPEMLRHHQQRAAIEKELSLTQARMAVLEQEFSRTFDPRESTTLIEEQGYSIDPHKHPIVLLEKP